MHYQESRTTKSNYRVKKHGVEMVITLISDSARRRWKVVREYFEIKNLRLNMD